jgi:hypothetical protein
VAKQRARERVGGLAGRSPQTKLVRPARLERATSWFAAVNTFVDPAQLMAQEVPKRAATWTQCWTHGHSKSKCVWTSGRQPWLHLQSFAFHRPVAASRAVTIRAVRQSGLRIRLAYASSPRSIGQPKSAAISRSGSHSRSVTSGTPGTHSWPNGPAGTDSCLAKYSAPRKCKTSARLFAVSSRTVRGGNPQRHSIILRTEV